MDLQVHVTSKVRSQNFCLKRYLLASKITALKIFLLRTVAVRYAIKLNNLQIVIPMQGLQLFNSNVNRNYTAPSLMY